jgi:nicotinamide riboside kinase
MRLRLAISGPAGSGKTTLMKALVDKPFMQGVEFLPEVVRELKKKYDFQINELASWDTELIIYTQHVQNLLLRDSFLSDRCVIDNYVYASLVNEFGEHKKEVPEFYLKQNREMVMYLSSRYDTIFYIPNEFPVEADGVRNIDAVYMQAVQDKFEEVVSDLEYSSYANIVRLTGSVEERIAQIEKQVGTIKKLKELRAERYGN